MSLALRLVLGVIFLLAGLPKVAHLESFANQIEAYQLVPERLVLLSAASLPLLEILTGVGLLLGLLTRSAALVAALLSALFAGVTGWALMRGLTIDCGCFPVPVTLHWTHPLADLLLTAGACWLVGKGPGHLSLDRCWNLE